MDSKEKAQQLLTELFNSDVTAPIVRDLMDGLQQGLSTFWLRVRNWDSDLQKLGINVPEPIELRILIHGK